MTVDVRSVNDAPAGADNDGDDATRTRAYTFIAGDFGFTRPQRHAGRTRSTAVKITTLPATGTLKLDGVAVTAGQFVSAADIDAGQLTFAPAANANGVAVRDASSSRSRTTAAPRTAASTSTSRRTRSPSNVRSVNDAPAGTDNDRHDASRTRAYTFAAGDFGFSDAERLPGERAAGGQDRRRLPTAGH